MIPESPLPREQATRLAKLLGMTGSAHDGEALNALRMATAMIRESGLTWQQIIQGAVDAHHQAIAAAFNDGYEAGKRARRDEAHAERQRQPTPRPRAWRAIVEKILAHHQEQLTDWEEKFLQSFLYRKWHTPTDRQRAVLERIAAKCDIQTPSLREGEGPRSQAEWEPTDKPPW